MFDKNTVCFKNSFSSNNDVLKVHCKSDKNDLGVHFVNRSNLYSFKVAGKFGLTLVECQLRHGYDFGSSSNLTAYAEFVMKFGKVYLWDAKDDGIYFSEDGDPEEYMYDWIL